MLTGLEPIHYRIAPFPYYLNEFSFILALQRGVGVYYVSIFSRSLLSKLNCKIRIFHRFILMIFILVQDQDTILIFPNEIFTKT